MYQSINVATADVREIAKIIGYRKKKARVVLTERVNLNGLNWSGGSRSVYTAVNLATSKASTPNLSMAPPWNNPAEGQLVDIPEGVAIVEHGTFMGKPGLMTIYVRPEAAGGLLPDA